MLNMSSITMVTCCHHIAVTDGNVVSMNNVTALEIMKSGHAIGIIMDYAVVDYWR